ACEVGFLTSGTHRLPLVLFSSLIRRAPSSTVFPYTTLFRSLLLGDLLGQSASAASVGRSTILGAKTAWAKVSRFEIWRAAKRRQDRKSTRLNSSHSQISYAVFCLKKKNKVKISRNKLTAAMK